MKQGRRGDEARPYRRPLSKRGLSKMSYISSRLRQSWAVDDLEERAVGQDEREKRVGGDALPLTQIHRPDASLGD